MPSRTPGEVAVVLGAGRPRGLGAGIARRLSAEGATVVVSDLEAGTELEEVAAMLSATSTAIAVPCDVREPSTVHEVLDAAVATYGRVDTVVYSVGVGDVIEPLQHLDPAAWDRVLRINLDGAFHLLRAAASAFDRCGTGGSITLLSSIGGRRGSPMLSAYNASKHGMLGLVRSAAAELGPAGVRVNAVCPNHVTTDMGAAQNALLSGRRAQDVEAYLEEMRQRIPLRRLATVEDVAAACAFLSSTDASFITGVALDVNGGELML